MLVEETNVSDAMPELPSELWLEILNKVAEMCSNDTPNELLQLMPTSQSFKTLILEYTSREFTLSIKQSVSSVNSQHFFSLQRLISWERPCGISVLWHPIYRCILTVWPSASWQNLLQQDLNTNFVWLASDETQTLIYPVIQYDGCRSTHTCKLAVWSHIFIVELQKQRWSIFSSFPMKRTRPPGCRGMIILSPVQHHNFVLQIKKTLHTYWNVVRWVSSCPVQKADYSHYPQAMVLELWAHRWKPYNMPFFSRRV